MKAQKIKMELELSPENALIVVIFLHTTVLYNNQFYNMLTEVSKNESMNIAQNIVNQICTMTYYKELRMKNTHTSLKNDFLNESGNIFN